MTQKDILLRTILKDDYETGRDAGEKILDYILAHPESLSDIKEARFFRDRVLQALGNALSEVFGNGLEYYLQTSRKRSLVDGRNMAMHILLNYGGLTCSQIARVFGKNHATVIFGCRKTEDLLSCDKGFAESYEQLKKSFINHYEESNI